MALILYTSGTTGQPKGVLISYRALNEKLAVLSRVVNKHERENILCALPTYFGHGLICNSLFAIYYSKNFYIAKKFDLPFIIDFRNYLKKFEISFFSTVPTVWDLILKFCPADKDNISFLKRVHCASSYLSKEKSVAIIEWLGDKVSFYNIFGITEMLGWIAGIQIRTDNNPNIFEDYWELQKKISSNGELFLKSEYMFSGYLENKPANKKLFTDDGFFKTGDIFLDGAYKGRSSLVINKNGIKIYPLEIDQFLLSSGMISDCHTFSLKIKPCREGVGIILTLIDGYSINQIQEYCAIHLSPTKFPDHFFLEQKIIRNTRGKISIQQIQQIQQKFLDEQER